MLVSATQVQLLVALAKLEQTRWIQGREMGRTSREMESWGEDGN